MAYATTIFPAKVALNDLLVAHTWTGGTPDIVWGQPTEAEDQTFDMVYQGDPETPEDTYVTLGASRVDEEFDLTVVVDVNRYGDDERSTEERAYSLLNDLLTVVNANHTLSGTVNRLTGWALFPINAPGGPQLWRTQLLIRVHAVGLVYPS